MAKITAAREMPLEGMPDAPEDAWFMPWLEQSNAVGRQVIGGFDRQLTVEENTTSLVKEITLVHGQSVTVSNPLSVPIQAIAVLGCTGLEVGSDGKPNGGIYDLANPRLTTKPSTKNDGSWVVTAYYPTDGLTSGFAGERVSLFVPAASAVSLSASGTIVDIGSISLGAGDWDISFNVAHNLGSAVTPTVARAWINTQSVTDPGTTANADNRMVSNDVPSASAQAQGALVGYRVSPTTTTTYFFSGNMTWTGGGTPASIYGSARAIRAVPYMTGRTGRVKLLFFGG